MAAGDAQVNRSPLAVADGVKLGVLVCPIWRWSALVTATLNPDLARAEGISPEREQLVLTLALAITVAVAVKVVGALLITTMLIIPAAAARPFIRSPAIMAFLAMFLSGGAVLGGVHASYRFDTPTGPTIVCVIAIFFVLSLSASRISRQR